MANHKPPVSVVVPILNEARYIREAMDSLISQDYEPLEVIVYDGGSTDGTLDILKTYPVEVIVEPGLGQMAAINRGWQRTKAEFVIWMAGDDRYMPGALRRLAEGLQARPNVGFVHADADLIDENGRVLGHLAPGHVELGDLVSEFRIIPQTTLIRRVALERAGMMVEGRLFAADWDLFLRLAQYYPSCYVPFTVAVRRLHAGSEDAQNIEAVGEASIEVLDQFFERPDLTAEQRALRNYGIAGSRLAAGWCYCVAGKRQLARRMLVQALRAAPKSILKTRSGRRLVLRLMFPLLCQPHWRTLKRGVPTLLAN